MINGAATKEIVGAQREHNVLPYTVAEMSLLILREATGEATSPEWVRYNLMMRGAGLVAGDQTLDEKAGIKRKKIL